MEEALFIERERARVTLDSIGDAVLSTDSDGKASYLNRVAEHLTGWAYGEAVGQPLAEIFNIIARTLTALFPEHHLGKGSVDVHANHPSHPLLLAFDVAGAVGDTTTTDPH